MMSHDIETRSVELAEAKAGIKLGAGHRVVLVVSGVKGTRRYLSKAQTSAPFYVVVKDQVSLVILGADGAAGTRRTSCASARGTACSSSGASSRAQAAPG